MLRTFETMLALRVWVSSIQSLVRSKRNVCMRCLSVSTRAPRVALQSAGLCSCGLPSARFEHAWAAASPRGLHGSVLWWTSGLIGRLELFIWPGGAGWGLGSRGGTEGQSSALGWLCRRLIERKTQLVQQVRVYVKIHYMQMFRQFCKGSVQLQDVADFCRSFKI